MHEARSGCLRMLAAMIAGCALLACSDAADDIDQFADCTAICDRYQECFDDNYDTSRCTDRCEDMDRRNEMEAVDDCESCIDDRSCAEAVFPCAVECAGIVP